MGAFSGVIPSVFLRVFRKTASLVRCIVATAVPMFVFRRHPSVPAVEDVDKTLGEGLCEPNPVEVLQGYFNDNQMQTLCVIEDISAPDFYEDILSEVHLDVQTMRDKEKWTYKDTTLLSKRLNVLKVYLRFIKECVSLPADLQENISEDILQKIEWTLGRFEALKYLFSIKGAPE